MDSGLTLYAIWQANTYTLTLDAQGGDVTPESISVTYNQAIGTIPDPTKTGYSFLEWNTASDGSGTTYSSATVYQTAGNMTIYARWTPNSGTAYTTEYYQMDTNGTTYSLHESVTLYGVTDDTANAVIKTYTGFTYDSLNANNVTSGAIIGDGSLVLKVYYSRNLYTVTFNDYDDSLIDTDTVYYQTDATAPEDPTRTGYTFDNWDTTYTNVTADITVTATYTANSYALTFNAMGGTVDPAFVSVTYDQAVGTLPTPTKAGYTFVAWNSANDGTGITYTSATVYQVAAGIIVYAMWEANDYTLTFNAVGGTVDPTSMTVTYNEAVGTLPTPTKPGYSFLEWNTASDGNGTTYDSSTVYMLTTGLTLYAIWDANDYTLTFDAAGGTVDPTSKTVTYNELVGTIPTPTRAGYDFVEWNTVANGSGDTYDNATTYLVVGDLTIYAVWQARTDTAYSVEYYLMNTDGSTYTLDQTDNLSGTTDTTATATIKSYTGFTYNPSAPGTLISGNINGDGSLVLKVFYSRNMYTVTFNDYDDTLIDTDTVYYMTDATAPMDPTRTGYTFAGWDGSYTSVTADITVTATYTANTYTITYDAQGGSVSPATKTVTYDQAVGVLPTPTYAGYTFNGWNTLPNGSGTTYTSATIYQVADDINLYAMWTANTNTSYTVEYYFENAEDDNYTLDGSKTQNLTGTTDTYVEATIQTYTGFDYASANGSNIIDGYIAGDGTLVLRVYYDRQVFTVQMIDSSGPGTGSFTVKYDGLLTSLTTPTREGYNFLGWVDGDGIFYTTSDHAENSLILYARWQQLSYTVTIQRNFYRGGVLASSSSVTKTIAYGTDYCPVTEIDGYTFDNFSYTLNSTLYEYFNETDTVNVTSVLTIYVHYDLDQLQISFTQRTDASDSSLVTTDYRYVYYGEDLPSNEVPALILSGNAAFSLVIWNRSVFTNVTENIDAFAVYYEADTKTITFMDNGTIRYLVSEDDVPSGPVVTDTSAIWNLTRNGYYFVGWFYEEAGINPVIYTELDFSTLANSITIYAVWQELTPFEVPTNLQVTLGVEGTSYNQLTWDCQAVNGDYPTEFILFVDGVEYTLSSGDFTQDVYTFTYVGADLDALFTAGTHHLAVKAVGDGVEYMSSSYSSVLEYVVETQEEEITDTQIYDYFIIETTASGTKNYIFYTDMTYNFSTKYSFQVLDGSECINANVNVLTTTGTTGTFQLLMTKNDSGVITETVIQGKVVTYINQFQLGSNLTSYLNTVSSSYYMESVVESYKVGWRNDFYFDLKILDNTGTRVDMANTDLDFTFYRYNVATSTYVELDPENLNVDDTLNLSTYVTVKDDYKFRFTAEAEGLTFKVEMTPHYQALQMTVPIRSFTFEVIDAYNAFTNEELQTLYGTITVHNIVLQSNITAEIDPLYVNEDGSPVNGVAKVLSGGSIDYRGNVYQRLGVASADSLVLNGNYFTIDGSDLPFVNASSDPNGNYTTVGIGDGSTYGVVSVQIAIFYYNVIPDSSYVNINNDNVVSYENLTVIGNTKTPSVNYSLSAEEILYQEELMIQNSGGLCGLMSRSGSMNVNNVNVGYTTIAVFQTSYAYMTDGTTPVTTDVSYFHAYDSWANSFYLYGTPLTYISSSNIDKSGGAAIHVEDTHPANTGIGEPVVNVSNDTIINNWISGDEAWFKAYGFSGLALMLKSTAELAVNAYNKTIIQMQINAVTGAETEMLNFVLLSRSTGGAETEDESHEQITGSEVTLILSDDYATTTINRDYDFFDYDFRSLYVSPGFFLFPVGPYSSTTAFADISTSTGAYYQAAYDYTQAPYSLSPENAQALAVDAVYTAAFYNLTLAEGELAAYYSQSGASKYDSVLYALQVYSDTMPSQPRYLEIGQPDTGTGLGSIQALVEIFQQD